jgi:tRNA dimethylallyltransferase
MQQGLECAVTGTGNAKVPAQTVARAAGNKAEIGRGADQRGGHLIHGAVATDGDDQLAALRHGLPGQFGGLPRPFRGDNGAVKPVPGDEIDGAVVEIRVLPIASGVRIEDEPDFQRREEADSETAWLQLGKSRFATNARKVCTGAMPRTLHVLTGCTAVGKTELALRWAEANGAEIVSCDSLLFYRGMDIGTAKPAKAELARVPHHLIDIREVTAQMDVTDYVTLVHTAVADLLGRGRKVLVSGGSGFYLKAFFAPVADEVEVPAELREELRQRQTALGLDAMVEELRRLNPAGLGTLDVKNPRRVVRALERCLASGWTLAELNRDFAAQPGPFADYEILLCELVREKGELDQRITQRVAAMLRAGLLDEVRGLLARGLKDNESAAKAIGYRESIACLEGRLPERELAETIAKNTRGLVKKQRTWFKTQLPAHHQQPAASVKLNELFG